MEKRKEFVTAIKNFRSMDPDKFFEFYKVHMSNLLELSSEEIEKSVFAAPEFTDSCRLEDPSSRKAFSSPFPIRKSTGSSDFLNAMEVDDDAVAVFRVLTNFIGETQNLSEEGIFRKSGSRAREEELRTRLCSKESDRFSFVLDGSVSAHDCASVLKKLLRSMPQPLLSTAHYHIYLKNADFTESLHCEAGVRQLRKGRRLDVAKLLIMLLPQENKRILRMILSLLSRVAAKSDANKMDAVNLATVFVPCILIPDEVSPEDVTVIESDLSQLLELMINHYSELFLPPQKFIMDVLHELHRKDKENLSSTEMPACSQNKTHSNGEYTALAMAELYASIASMPEGPEKQKRIKQLQKHSRENVRTPEKSVKAVGARFVKSIKKKLTIAARSDKHSSSDTVSVKSYDSGISNENFLEQMPVRNRSCDGLDALSDYSSLTIESSTSWDYYSSKQIEKKLGDNQSSKLEKKPLSGVLSQL